MRLRFNILWIDDQPNNIRGYQSSVEPVFETEGFQLHVIPASSLEEATAHISEEGIMLDNVDLVLIDYDLGPNEKGDDVAREVRKRVPFKDIVFYSAVETKDLYKKISDQQVEGVYCAHRDDLADKIKGLFKDIIRRVLDLEHMRGIVMGATSEYEQLISEAIVKFDKILSDDERVTLVTYADGKLEKAEDKLSELRAGLKTNPSLQPLTENHEFSAAPRIDLVRKILAIKFQDQHKETSEGLGNYRQNTMPKRNKLGHARVRINGSNQELQDNGNPYSLDELKALRRELLDCFVHFQKVAEVAGVAV